MSRRALFVLLSCFALAVLGGNNDCGSQVPIPPCGLKRTISGECNNPIFTSWGKGGQYLRRGAEGVKWANGTNRDPVLTPNMRTVSNEIFRADENKLQEDGLNLYWVFMGQFIAHDLQGVNRMGDNGLDQNQPGAGTNTTVFNFVPIEQCDDSFFSQTPPINGGSCAGARMRVLRSRGDFVNGRFEVGSESTSYLDLDVVYGKEEHVTELLRAHTGGLLKSRNYVDYAALQGGPPGLGTTINPAYRGTYGEWMPLVDDVDPIGSTNPGRSNIPISPQLVPGVTYQLTKRFFATGDPRNGENYGLNTFHGLFFREHQRIARKAAAENPAWSDEQIFQFARNQNIAQYQAIVLYEYLPALLGKSEFGKLVGDYDSYDLWVDAQASQLFAFSFRFGHTTVPNAYSLQNRCGGPAFNSSRDGPRSTQGAPIFMPADQMAENGKPENVLHALLFQGAKAVDFQFPEQLRTIGFGANTDITVQNQMRAADSGIPDYNTIRKLWYGGKYPSVYQSPDCYPSSETSAGPDRLGCWLLFTKNTTAAEKLRTLYGKVNNLNFYTAVVGEELDKSVVGPTSARIIADQFKRSRDGDRWWFENEGNGLFSRSQIRDLKKTTIADLLRINFPTANVQDEAFYLPEAKRSKIFKNCAL